MNTKVVYIKDYVKPKLLANTDRLRQVKRNEMKRKMREKFRKKN